MATTTAAIEDVGEYIPYAKKSFFGNNGTPAIQPATPKHPPANDAPTTLKSVWPEPDWTELYEQGFSRQKLAQIYCLYHGLPKKSHRKCTYSVSGYRPSPEEWDQAYIEVVSYLRDACMTAQQDDFLPALKSDFALRYRPGNKATYKTYAAGHMTRRYSATPLALMGRFEHLVNVLPELDWPTRVDEKKIPLLPVKLKDIKDRRELYVLASVGKNGSVSWRENGIPYKNDFPTITEAIQALVEHYAETFTIQEPEEADTSKKDVYQPAKIVDGLVGVGPDFASKTAEQLMQVFGFRGVQFGNYITQKERQAFIDNTYRSLEILALILGVPHKWIGGGTLGLAIGARGRGGSKAHYEPDQHVINLTRFNGPGSIAHEFCHAFDRRIAALVGLKGKLLSERIGFRHLRGLWGLPEEIKDAKDTKHVGRLRAFLTIIKACTDDSDFVTNARNLTTQHRGPKYWSSYEELFARAFEAYIQDIVEERFPGFQWLAHGTLESDYPMNGMHPYPTGQDRQRIASVMSQCLPVVFGR